MKRRRLINIFSFRRMEVPHSWFHVLLILMLLFVVSPLHVTGSVPQFLLHKAISLIFPLALVYINIYILIPVFFKQNKWLYTIMFLLLLILFTLASYLRFQWIDPVFVPSFIRQDQPITSLLSLLIFMTLTNAAMLFFKTTITGRMETEAKHNLEQSLLETEPRFLKLPIAPHFYFNIMNSIYHSITLNPPQAENILLQLTGMMQFYIYECSKEKVQLESEIDNIHNYIELQKMRLASEPRISVEVTGDPAKHSIAPFILIAFVENAYKHGLAEPHANSFLEIQLLVNKNTLQFRSVNSKSNSDNNEKPEAGNGLQNVKKRLELLYPSQHKLVIEDSPNQYAVSLDLQLN